MNQPSTEHDDPYIYRIVSRNNGGVHEVCGPAEKVFRQRDVLKSRHTRGSWVVQRAPRGTGSDEHDRWETIDRRTYLSSDLARLRTYVSLAGEDADKRWSRTGDRFDYGQAVALLRIREVIDRLDENKTWE